MFLDSREEEKKVSSEQQQTSRQFNLLLISACMQFRLPGVFPNV